MKNKLLSIDQVANVCGVSPDRVRRWIEKRGLKTDPTNNTEEFVHHADMIDFFVKFNMPIPDSILPFKTKKILFIYDTNSDNKVFMSFLIEFLGNLRTENNNFITDHISYGPDAKIKLMVFNPDLVLLDMTENDNDAINMSIQIKSTEEFNKIKLVAITSDQLLELYKNRAVACGIDEILPYSMNLTLCTKSIISHNGLEY
ncbi:MAG: hypothetical protein KKD63_14580 [Proteobacteria bacterium]|nr:helix-turn-helix domain-containing protein [Desulfobulbaceae bacterium]MBU4154095.1 hypothetical protein [Pseudomonadota bacterium]